MTTQNVSRCCVDVFFGAHSPLPDSTVLGNTHWHIFGIGMVTLILAVEVFWSKGAKEPAEAGSEEGAAALLTSSCAADPPSPASSGCCCFHSVAVSLAAFCRVSESTLFKGRWNHMWHRCSLSWLRCLQGSEQGGRERDPGHVSEWSTNTEKDPVPNINSSERKEWSEGALDNFAYPCSALYYKELNCSL